jgi:hypothetical protein
VAAAAGSAQAQSNLDAGKSPAQIFSDTCNACHRSPRELKQSNPGFLREHYTTGAREAAAMAAYLASVGSDPRAVQQRRPPALGGGSQGAATETGLRPPQTTPPTADPAKPQETKPQETKPQETKPQETQAALPATTRRPPTAAEAAKPAPGGATAALVKPRRPSESVEAGRLPVAAAPGGEIASPQPAAAPSADFEE